jgi:hypothetical protein
MMSSAAAMIDPGLTGAVVDTQLLADTVDVLVEAARTARQCADACVHDASGREACISLSLDAADVASATSNVVIRMADPHGVAAVLDSCRTILRLCGEECQHHAAHLRQCAVCAEVCGRAEELCLRLLAALRACGASDDQRIAPRRPTRPSASARPTHDALSPGATMGRSGAAAEPNEPA